MQNSSVLEAHIHALEKLERNGKWKVRGVEALDTLTPQSPEPGVFRYRHLTSAKGPSFEIASDEAWKKFQSDPSLRSYLAQAIRRA
jgi:hypothetical protein